MDRLHSALNRISHRQQSSSVAVDTPAPVGPVEVVSVAVAPVAVVPVAMEPDEPRAAQKSVEGERAVATLNEIDQILADLLAELAIDEHEIHVPAPNVEETAVILPPAAVYLAETEPPLSFDELELPAETPVAVSVPFVEESASTGNASQQFLSGSALAAGDAEKETLSGSALAAGAACQPETPAASAEPLLDRPGREPEDQVLMPGPSWCPRSVDIPNDEPEATAPRQHEPSSFFKLMSGPDPRSESEANEPVAEPAPEESPAAAPLEEPPAAVAGTVEPLERSAIDELRDSMTADLAAGQAHTIALVAVEGSANRGGTVAQLVESFARLGHGSVLAVDASFGSSQLAVDLGARPAPGIIELLAATSDSAGIKIAETETRVAGVSYLGSGVGANPNLVPGDPRWTQLDAACRAAYRWTIIDAGEARSTGQTVASLCDAVYLVVCLRETPRREAAAAIQRLHEAGVRLRGCILIGDDAALGQAPAWPLTGV